jgi:hypothetical protein
METAALPLASVIGANARECRLRAGLTLDQVSVAARARGLKWSESRVADFEAGRVASSLNTLLAICLALADAGCTDATLPLLVKYVVPMQINESLQLLDVDVVNLLAGRPVETSESSAPAPTDAAELLNWKLSSRDRKIAHRFEVAPATLVRVSHAQGAAEARMSKSLGIAPPTLAHLSGALWNRTFSQERDRRAGDGANAQKRGQVSRSMREELKAAIEGSG